ncbi:folate-binding protein [Luteimonas sp. BDR2-5]|uniref:CAF17-like 4Fe-4S cluster assembly/insertion protein YgfZ n=1 Tax=Proluteimonas luteida TaxID=2878685 RepID=UPI001E2BE6E3|nr:folate-binding protein [Luteimonas sp. BDR2-5]MCD9028599.1 folate-binding protein [Luteimonas sp. BDR2-5]
MSDKLELPVAAFFAVPGAHCVRLEGRDAVAFAQAQFTSDVTALADGHWHWSAWLTPKGRVVAIFALLRVHGERIDLVLLDAVADAFAASLQRFVFRSKLRISVPDAMIAGGMHAPGAAAGSALAAMDGDAIEIDFGDPGSPRTLRIVDGGPCAPESADFAAQWRHADLEYGLPRLPASQREQWTPQQLSLERLRAYSIRKGCYPGQEIVARTHFLGQAKRGLFALESAATPEPGSDVLLGERVAGKLVCSAGTLHLAVLAQDLDPAADLAVAGQPAVLRPLRDGLAR